MLRYYMHISEPEKLSDEQWALQIKLLEKIRKEEAKSNGFSTG